MEFQIWVACWITLFAGTASCVRFRVQRQGLTRSETCVRCGYDMSGLGEEAICPECGNGRPRWKPQLGRIQTELHPYPGFGLVGIGSILFGLDSGLVFTWTLFHREASDRCPIEFGLLDGDPVLAAASSFLVCIVFYLASLVIARKAWLASTWILGLSAALGAHAGVSLAAVDHYAWHRAAFAWVFWTAVGSAFAAQGLFLLGHRLRRPRAEGTAEREQHGE
ncbi:MAG: hypothetical protein DYG94_01215 [Leptolyngbya sp. PLA3]|nr:MAG: hypothetical protein EDM82_00665 [Cyanobacteria bacterium CYA]MCE7967350.1 hypothetical protein [Leptolyngbya sp. PL-A3]